MRSRATDAVLPDNLLEFSRQFEARETLAVPITDFIRRLFLKPAKRFGTPESRGPFKAVRLDDGAAGLVDYRALAAKYTFCQHAERSDAYFSSVNQDSPVARKPFASPLESVELTSGIGAILSNLFLFNGAKVLDFGAGGCWLSRILALLGCDVTAADISKNALRFGRELLEKDPLSKHLKIAYAPLTDGALPFADASFDRIVCFDALHHCSDQKAVIREFFRVLRDGGIAAFHEPGPQHSTKIQSQQEMRNFEVIEGDIVLEDLAHEASLVGFSKVELAVFAANPAIVSLEQFNYFMDSPEDSEPGKKLVLAAWKESENRRIFFLHKGDVLNHIDSRSPVGLLAQFDVQTEYSTSGVTVRGTVTNIGAANWLPSELGTGSVNVGIHLYDEAGKLVNYDFARFSLSPGVTSHGQSVPVDFLVPLPEGREQFQLAIDLVAEGITWFETGCSAPVNIRVDRIAGYSRIRPQHSQ